MNVSTDVIFHPKIGRAFHARDETLNRSFLRFVTGNGERSFLNRRKNIASSDHKNKYLLSTRLKIFLEKI